MGIAPEQSWSGRHTAITTILIMLLIVSAGVGLKMLQNKYFPAKPQEYNVPVLLNESYQQTDQHFNIYSNLSDDQKDNLFRNKYMFNIANWTCKPLGCQKMFGKYTLKLTCKDQGFTEDVRIAMDDDCTDAAQKQEITVICQLMTRTTGEYDLGRSGRIVNK